MASLWKAPMWGKKTLQYQETPKFSLCKVIGLKNYLRTLIICVKKTHKQHDQFQGIFVADLPFLPFPEILAEEKLILLFNGTANYIHYCFLIEQDRNPQKTKMKVITGIVTLS